MSVTSVSFPVSRFHSCVWLSLHGAARETDPGWDSARRGRGVRARVQGGARSLGNSSGENFLRIYMVVGCSFVTLSKGIMIPPARLPAPLWSENRSRMKTWKMPVCKGQAGQDPEGKLRRSHWRGLRTRSRQLLASERPAPC